MIIKDPQRKIMVLSAIIGILLIVPLCYDMATGVIMGMNSNKELFNDKLGYTPYPVCLETTPKEELMQMQQSNRGLLGYMDIKREGIYFLPKAVLSPTITTINAIISFVAVACAIYYIISVIKSVPIIARRGLMNAPAIKQLRRVSYSMLLSYILFALASYLPTWYYSRHIDLAQYTVSYPRISESLVTAVILILLTEILGIARQLKEEQELTI